MADDTTAALQALIQQLQKLTSTVERQQKTIDEQQSKFDGLHKQNVRLLDQVKDNKRAAADPLFDRLEQERKQRELDALNLEQMPDGSIKLKSGSRDDGVQYISRADARDAQRYREAKVAAQAAGLELRVLADREDPTRRNTGRPEPMQSLVFTFDDDHERIRWLRADMETGSGIVQRRLQAERDGFTVNTFNSVEDLPDHARTKFRLMEKEAQNAQDTDS